MNEKKIVELLVRRGHGHMRRKESDIMSFSGDEDSDRLVCDLKNYPHAFVIACIADRQIKAERAWAIPYKLKERIGSFEFEDLSKINEGQWFRLFKSNKRKGWDFLHFYNKEISKCVHDAITLIGGDQYRGDASKIWSGNPSSAGVVYRFLQFRGVGPKIATMAAAILARRFKIKFSDYYLIDVSADIHIRRVFYRLGLTEEKASRDEIIYRARGLYPKFPGLIDAPCWHIGRDWCRPKKPQCDQCYMNQVCPRKGLLEL